MAYFIVATAFGALSLLAAFSTGMSAWKLWHWPKFSGQRYMVASHVGTSIYNAVWAILVAVGTIALAESGVQPPAVTWISYVFLVAIALQAIPATLLAMFVIGMIEDSVE